MGAGGSADRWLRQDGVRGARGLHPAHRATAAYDAALHGSGVAGRVRVAAFGDGRHGVHVLPGPDGLAHRRYLLPRTPIDRERRRAAEAVAVRLRLRTAAHAPAHD